MRGFAVNGRNAASATGCASVAPTRKYAQRAGNNRNATSGISCASVAPSPGAEVSREVSKKVSKKVSKSPRAAYARHMRGICAALAPTAQNGRFVANLLQDVQQGAAASSRCGVREVVRKVVREVGLFGDLPTVHEYS